MRPLTLGALLLSALPLLAQTQFTVTTTADAGAGSLRAAIEAANAAPCPELCHITFALDEPLPASRWYTIEPRTPLPELTAARAVIDASTLPDTNPNGPELLIDGRFLVTRGDGLRIATPCEGGVRGLAVGNFLFGFGVVAIPPPGCPNSPGVGIANNYLGVAPDGVTPLPNGRGAGIFGGRATIFANLIRANANAGVWTQNCSVDIRSNRIELNIAAGVFCGPNVFQCAVTENFIAHNLQAGVAVARGGKVSVSTPGGGADIRMNGMYANGKLPIDIGIDGPNPPVADDTGMQSNPPTILSARYDAATNTTLVTVHIDTKPLGPYINTGVIDVYLNEHPDGDGEQFVAERFFASEGQDAVVEIAGDHTGKWVNATSTRVHFIAKVAHPNAFAGGESWTSEFSPAVRVTP